MGAVFIITGASGTGIATGLARYSAGYGAHVVKVEDHLAEVAKRYTGDGRTRPSMREILRLPPAQLRTLWPEALRRALDEGGPGGQPLQEVVDETDVLLTFHAAWYHLESTSFVAAVDTGTLNVELINRSLTPRKVITLTDDIYDTLARLTRPHQVFERELIGRNPIAKVAELLLKILAWREFEVRYSEQISASFLDDVPHVLFAVKHPLATFATLLRDEAPWRIYLSHPISWPRKAGLEIGHGKELMDFVSKVSAEVRARGEFALIEPTAIDEMRIDIAREGIPLTPRWRLPQDENGKNVELLWDGLASTDSSQTDLTFAEQPFLEAFGRAERQRRHLTSASEQLLAVDLATRSANDLVEVLRTELQRQVNWRDRQLVSESHGLLVLRPFSKPEASHSRSVGREMDLHLQLREFEKAFHRAERRSRAIVYHPHADESRRRVEAILRVCRYHATGDERLLDNLTAEGTERLRSRLSDEDLEAWLECDAGEVGRRLTDLFADLPDDTGPALVVPSGSGLEVGKHLYASEQNERLLGSSVLDAIRGTEVLGHRTHQKILFTDPLHTVIISETYDSPAALGRQLTGRVAVELDELEQGSNAQETG